MEPVSPDGSDEEEEAVKSPEKKTGMYKPGFTFVLSSVYAL